MTPIPGESLARDARSSMVLRISAYGLSLFSAVVVARALGPSGKGILSLALVVPGLVASVGGLGLSTAATVAGREGWLPRRSVLLALAAYSVVLGLLSVAGALLWGIGVAQSWEATRYAFASLSSVGGLLLVENAAGVLQGRGAVRSGMAFRYMVGIGLSGLAVGMIVLGVREALPIILAGAAWVWACGAAALGVAALRSVPGPLVRDSWVREFLAIGLRTQGLWILMLLNYRLDTVLLGMLSTASEVGVYSVAIGFSEVGWFAVNALVAVLLPHLMVAEPDTRRIRAARALRISVAGTVALTGLVAVVLALASVPVFGPGFEGTPLVFLLLMPGLVTLAAFKVLAVYAISIRRILVPTMLAAGGLALDVALNVALAPAFGSRGAAMASSISYGLIAIGTVAWFVRQTELSLTDTLLPVAADVRAVRAFVGLAE